MSSAIARARSPATSISATSSHRRASAIRAAVVAPTMPAPTTATRVIPGAPAAPSRAHDLLDELRRGAARVLAVEQLARERAHLRLAAQPVDLGAVERVGAGQR